MFILIKEKPAWSLGEKKVNVNLVMGTVGGMQQIPCLFLHVTYEKGREFLISFEQKGK